MGKKARKRILKAVKITLGSLLGLVLLLVIAVNVLLSESVVRKLVDKYVPELIDGELTYAHSSISVFTSFPYLDITLTDLALTYPSEMFPEAGEACVPGRIDTLLAFSELRVSVNYMDLISEKYDVRELLLRNPHIYAHCYTSKVANWNVIKSTRPSDSDDDDDDDDESSSSSAVPEVPRVKIGKVRFCGDARIDYSSVPDEISVSARFEDIGLDGDVVGYGLDDIVERSRLALTSSGLVADIRSGSETISLDLDHLALGLKDRRLSADLSTDLDYFDGEGRYETPVSVLTDINLPAGGGKEGLLAQIEKFEMDVFDLPIVAKGSFSYYTDSLWMDLRADAKNVKPKTLLTQYAANYLDEKDIFDDADARLSLWLTAKGSSCGDVYPVMNLGLEKVNFDASDVSLVADAAMWNVLADDPLIDFVGDFDAELEKVCEYLPSDSGIEGKGSLCVKADAKKIKLSQLDPNNFAKANLTLSADGSDIDLRMGEDHYVADTLRVRMSGSKNTGKLTAVVTAGQLTADVDDTHINLKDGIVTLGNSDSFISSDLHPLEAEMKFRRLTVDSGQERIAASKVGASLSITPRDTTRHYSRPGQLRRQRTVSQPGNDAFKSGDIDISVDKQTSDYLKDWSFSGKIAFTDADYRTPEFPLTNSITNASLTFTDNELKIEKMAVASGDSRFTANGTVNGLRRAMAGRGRIRANLSIDAQYLNADQLLAASEAGERYRRSLKASSSPVSPIVADTTSVADTKPVADTATVADPTYSSLLIIPANLVLDLKLKARNVFYSDLRIQQMSGELHAKDRCAQILDTRMVTNMGELGFDGFYYSKTEENIAAGFNLVLMDVSAEQVIALIPEVDDVLPQLKSFEGNMNLELTATTMLDTNMEPIGNTLNGVFKIGGNDLLLRDLGDFKSVAKLMLFRDTKKGYIKSLNVCGVVNDSSLELFPFLLKVDRYSLGLSGIQNFDETFKYHASVIRSPLLVKFGVDLFGNFDNFDYKIRGAKYKREKMPAYDERVDVYQERLITMIRNIHDVSVEQAFLDSRSTKWLTEVERHDLEEGFVSDDSLDSQTLEMISKGEFTSPDKPAITAEGFMYIPVKSAGLSLPAEKLQ